jgi:membrane-bound lytic murein transglycosylase MltF
MQLMPETGASMKVGDVTKPEPNVHAGVKYMRFMMEQYFADEKDLTPLNKALFAFASYNAGPNRIARLRNEAKKTGLDPNVWFNNVETVVAKRVGQEPVVYVSNIYKYYLAYRLLTEQQQARDAATKSVQ